MDYDWDWELANREYRAALALNPNDADAYQAHAHLLLALAQPDAAAAEADKALQLDPLSPGINATLAWVYYLAHDYPRCVEQCRRTLELYPDFVVARQVSALAHIQQKQWHTATDELHAVQRIAPENPITGLLQAQQLAAEGRADETREMLARMLRENNMVSAYYVAGAYATLGRADDAFQWLDQAYAAHSNWLIYLKLDPRFDPVRGDRRFPALLQKIAPSK